MNVTKGAIRLASFLFIVMTGMLASCVEDEQAPFSGGEGNGFYVQMPGYGTFYWGSEVVLKGNDLSEITKVYVEGISPDMDEDKWENGDYDGMSDMDGDGIPDEFQRIEARITERTNQELTFILPANTERESTMVYYERGGELQALNVLDNVFEPSMSCYLNEEAGNYVITIYGDAPLSDDRVYVQYLKYDDWGEAFPVTGEWIEVPVISSDETGLIAQPIGVGEMRVRYVHNGEEIVFSYTAYVEPMYIIRFPEGTNYYAGDEVTITGGFFEEGDVISLNSVPAEIISIDTERDALTFRIPENSLYNQQVWLNRNGLDFFVKEIYVQERN